MSNPINTIKNVKNYLAYVVILLILPLWIRFESFFGYFPTESSYTLANQQIQGSILLNIFSNFLTPTPFANIIILLVIFVFIISQLNSRIQTITLMLMALTPGILYYTLVPSWTPFIITCLCLLYAIFKKYHNLLIIISIVPLFGLEYGVLALLYLVFFYTKRIIPIVLTTIALILNTIVTTTQLSPQSNIIFFGAINGYSLVSMIFFIIALTVLWDKRNKFKLLFIAICAILSTIFPQLILFVSLLTSILAAIVIIKYDEFEWITLSTKYIALGSIWTLIFVSYIFYAQTIIMQDPVQVDIQFYEFLKDQPGQVVFTHAHDKTYMVEIAHKQPIVYDKYTTIIKEPDLTQTLSYFFTNNITIIHIDDHASDVWTTRNEGLLAHLQNQRIFEPIYDNHHKAYRIIQSNASRELRLLP